MPPIQQPFHMYHHGVLANQTVVFKTVDTSPHFPTLPTMENGLMAHAAGKTTSYVSFKIGTNIFLFTKENQRKEKDFDEKILLFSNLEKEN